MGRQTVLAVVEQGVLVYWPAMHVAHGVHTDPEGVDSANPPAAVQVLRLMQVKPSLRTMGEAHEAH
jgi:hypothetical protein